MILVRESLSNLFLNHFPEIIPYTGQAIGVDDKWVIGCRVMMTVILPGTCQHQMKSAGLTGQIIMKIASDRTAVFIGRQRTVAGPRPKLH